MYRSDILWQTPNHEFTGIFSSTEFMSGHVAVEKASEFHGDLKTAHSIIDRFVDFHITKRNFPQTQRLDSDEQIIEATLKDLMLIARTELRDDAGNLRAMIEYPIKTMNVQEEHGRFQVDTGPLLFPDLASPVDGTIESLSMAFVCYNNFDVAEFVLRQPTPVMEGGNEVASVIEYSGVRRVEVKNDIFCVGNI